MALESTGALTDSCQDDGGTAAGSGGLSPRVDVQGTPLPPALFVSPPSPRFPLLSLHGCLRFVGRGTTAQAPGAAVLTAGCRVQHPARGEPCGRFRRTRAPGAGATVPSCRRPELQGRGEPFSRAAQRVDGAQEGQDAVLGPPPAVSTSTVNPWAVPLQPSCPPGTHDHLSVTPAGSTGSECFYKSQGAWRLTLGTWLPKSPTEDSSLPTNKTRKPSSKLCSKLRIF